MKSLKPLLAVAAAVFMLAALALPVSCAKNVKEQNAPQSVAVPDTVVSETVLPPAKFPVLKIGGKEDPDVYLQSLDIQVEVTGNIASTRYTMVFKNKTGRILEGELTFPLPDGRTVTHYALDVNGKMRDAVPVEKARATQVLEEIEQRRVVIDPGLLERVEGNNFRTRIYPFPAYETRTISIGYEEELPLENSLLYYRLPMAYPDPLEKFSVKATVWSVSQKPLVPNSEDEIRFDQAGESYAASLTRENYRPSRALVFALPAPADIPQVIMQPAQGSYYFLASVAPAMETRKKQWNDELAIIWDISLSGSQRNLQREMEMLDIIFKEKKNANVHLYFLNNKFKKIAGKSFLGNGAYKVSGGEWKELKNVLETAVFDGGTDFSQINLNDITGKEILFFSDGLSTLSDADFLKNANLNRPVHCVVSSAKSDYSAMKLIAGKTKGKFVNANALPIEKLKSELLNETLQFLGTEKGNAAREVYPDIAMPVHGNFSVAGIADANDAELTLLFGFGNKVEKRIKVKLDAKNADEHGNAYKIWAQKKIAELDLEYEKNRSELTELGRQFGIVTRNTSLIVLETVADYVLYGIEPPATEPELRAEYLRKQGGKDGRRDVERNMFNEALLAAENLKKWHNTDFTPKKSKYPTPDKNQPVTQTVASSSSGSSVAISSNKVKSKRGDILITDAAGGGKAVCQASFNDEMTIVKKQESTTLVKASCGQGWVNNADIEIVLQSSNNRGMKLEAVDISGWLDNPSAVFVLDQGPSHANFSLSDGSEEGNFEESGSASSQPTITIKPIKKDNDYLKILSGKIADDYQIYLKLREDYSNSPTFYFDMADWFYKLGDKETALRILTSIADLELENASLYRLLGYRFKEYGELALAKFVCQKVIQWRPMEPQSYRDYALALADNGEEQAALDSLYSMLTKNYSENIIRRSQGIEEVVVTEINRLIAKNAKLNASKIDKRLLVKTPVDIRVVINWNMNNTDIDLLVKDPNNEICGQVHRTGHRAIGIGGHIYNVRKQTSIGGRMSADNRDDYGPEQFMLKNAIKGKYQVYVNYFGDRQFTSAGPSTIMAEIFTKYAGEAEQRQVVSLQMSNAKKADDKIVEAAEFEF